MDARANTHICDAPVVQPQAESPPPTDHAAYFIMIAGGIPGSMLRLSDQPTRLGRSSDNTFQLYDTTVSRHHASVSIDPFGSVWLGDEGSTNGTFVNGRRIKAHRAQRLEDGDRVQLGTGVVLKLVRLDPCDERFQREMFERTVRDGMTGLYNRAYFLNQVGSLGAQSGARGNGVAILMVDVDHFKQINDRYGHPAGDSILCEVAAVIRESTRPEDLVARYGGEEFIVALPVSAPDLATERAERIRSNVEARRILAGDQEIRVTVSIGLAFGPPGRPRHEPTLIQAADQALYQAKADGRNRVVFGPQPRNGDSQQTQSAEFSTASGSPLS
jgi:diguanylate cyclase (GGDEF)-like protein